MCRSGSIAPCILSGRPHLLAALLQQNQLPSSFGQNAGWDHGHSGEEPLILKKTEPRIPGHLSRVVVIVLNELTRLNGFPLC